MLNRNCSSQNKPNSSWCVRGKQHSNPWGGKAGRESGAYSTCTRSVGAWTCLSCYEGLTQPESCLQTPSEYSEVEDRKNSTVTAILSQHRRDFWFCLLFFSFYIKRLIKNIEKILISFYIFNPVEFQSFLENYGTLERALEFTTSCKEDTQNAYKRFGAPAHTRPNSVHKEW